MIIRSQKGNIFVETEVVRMKQQMDIYVIQAMKDDEWITVGVYEEYEDAEKALDKFEKFINNQTRGIQKVFRMPEEMTTERD